MPQPLPGIDHVVLLMFENRSFDNIFGGFNAFLSGLGLTITVNGLNGDETNPVDGDPDDSHTISVQQIDDPTTPSSDPNELYDDMTAQIYAYSDDGLKPNNPSDASPTMLGFARNYSAFPSDQQPVLTYFDQSVVPITWLAALMGAVSDTFYAAAPCQTFANRVMSICATPGVNPESNEAYVDDTDYFPTKLSLTDVANAYGSVTDTSIFELFDQQYPSPTNPNWKVYYHDTPFSALVSYVNDQYDATNPAQTTSANVVHYDDSDFPLPDGYATFANDVANGTLPMFSIIEPRYHSNWSPPNLPPNSNHPGATQSLLGQSNGGINSSGSNNDQSISVSNGEALLFDVLSTLLEGSAANPDPLSNTLLIITYDEHGGIYDHVPPPTSVPTPFNTPPSSGSEFLYDRLGVRVPAIFIGGGVAPQTVFEAPSDATYPWFDHTSIIKTLWAQFGLLNGPLTPRDGNVPDLSGLITVTDAKAAKTNREAFREKLRARSESSRLKD